jgi:hypothetical protein
MTPQQRVESVADDVQEMFGNRPAGDDGSTLAAMSADEMAEVGEVGSDELEEAERDVAEEVGAAQPVGAPPPAAAAVGAMICGKPTVEKVDERGIAVVPEVMETCMVVLDSRGQARRPAQERERHSSTGGVRLLHTADLHLGLTRYGHPTASGGNSRIDDFALTLDHIADVAIEQKVAAVVVAGDLFNTRREGPQERNAFARFARRLQAAGIALIIVPGNHDGMSTVGDATTHALLWIGSLELDGVHLLVRPGAHVVPTRDGPLVVFAVPYPHKRASPRSSRTTGRRSDPGSRQAARRDHPQLRRARGRVHGAGVERSADHPRRPLHHRRAALGSEQSMKMSWDVSISPDTFGPFDGVLLGHIHRQQQVAPNAWYAGAPEYIDFGEQEHRKGFLLWTTCATCRAASSRAATWSASRSTHRRGRGRIRSAVFARQPSSLARVTSSRSGCRRSRKRPARVSSSPRTPTASSCSARG